MGNDIYQITSDNYNKNIYILTHPIWWSNEKSSPRNKIKTSIENRARKNLIDYDEDLKNLGRPNLY